MAKSRLNTIRRTMGGETTLEGAIDAMGRGREEQVLRLIAEFSDRVVFMVEKLQDAVDHFVNDRYAELGDLAKELDALESEADTAKESIINLLSMGAIFPMQRVNLARLVSSMDRIANLTAGVTALIAMRKFTLPTDVNHLLVNLASTDLEAVKALREAARAMGTNLREAITLAGEVDKLEGKVDDIFDDIYKHTFELDTDYKTFHQLQSIIDRLESIADRCSNSAELIRHMALEYLETK